MPLTKVLITVKTYPTISVKYDELVCTAGFLEDGTWIRIYPVQFRKKSYTEQYGKYHWVELDLVKFRPESYRPHSLDGEIKIVGEIKPDGDAWTDRRKFVLKNVHTNLNKLITEAKDKNILTSLAVFKPKKVTAFKIESTDREWSKEKIESLNQLNLFEKISDTKQEVVRKLPYKFFYTFLDDENHESTLMIEDWEIGQLYWNCLKRREGNETLACEDVRQKYFEDFAKTKDLYLFLGTSKSFHLVGPNPFMIIGTFHPKPITQTSLF
jgi:hypothetical protein